MQIHKTRCCVGLALPWASVSPFAQGVGVGRTPCALRPVYSGHLPPPGTISVPPSTPSPLPTMLCPHQPRGHTGWAGRLGCRLTDPGSLRPPALMLLRKSTGFLQAGNLGSLQQRVKGLGGRGAKPLLRSSEPASTLRLNPVP